ncbi:hypothetical protein LB503_008298 [Fusarium chuoi]|nr:hypothetical protein LB503_008298 [Fusarium chuoi]
MSSRADHRVYANMSSPAEGAADSIQGTPNTQITVFSPAESSQGTSIQGNNYLGQGQAPEDPGVAQGSTLSATASSFEPLGQRFKGKNALVFYPKGSPTVAGALSQDMDISHRIEVCDTPAPSIVELGNYITELTQKGVRFHGGRNLETDGGHVYVVFEDLRDAAWAFYAIRKAPKGWFTAYVKIRPERLSIEVNVLNFSIIDPAHVDEIAQRALNVYGQLFALLRHLSYPNGAFRGVAQFCKAADAFIAFKAFGNGITTGGVVITLSKPEDVGIAASIDNQLAGAFGSMAIQQGPRGVDRGRHQSFFALNAPQGNPFAAAGAASIPFPPTLQQQPFTGQQFGPPGASNTLALTNPNGFGRFDPRRGAGRYGRGSRGLNNIVDLNELIAGRDVRTTVSPTALSCITITPDISIDHASQHSEQGGPASFEEDRGCFLFWPVRLYVPAN